MSVESIKDALVTRLAAIGGITVTAVVNHAPDETNDIVNWGDQRTSYAINHIYREIPIAIGPVETPFVTIGARSGPEMPVANGATVPMRKVEHRVLIGLTVLDGTVWECSRAFDALQHAIAQKLRSSANLAGLADVANESQVVSALEMTWDTTDPEELGSSIVQRGVCALTVREYVYG